jgi:trk system potassium uptake protein TrkH
MIMLGAFVFSMFGVSFIDAFSASISHMGNVGPAFGSVGSLDNYSNFPAMAKFLSTVQMLLGRLEIYTLLVIFVVYKWR